MGFDFEKWLESLVKMGYLKSPNDVSFLMSLDSPINAVLMGAFLRVLDENSKLRDESALHISLEAHEAAIFNLKKKLKTSKKIQGKFREGLQFYANGFTTWEGSKIIPQDRECVEGVLPRIGGKKARKILKKWCSSED